jgi:uncharacterized DUF497 family protein
MRDDAFEWDDVKAMANLARHGVAFDVARGVFRDPFAIDWLDDRQEYGEPRYATIGMAAGRLIYVAYTMRAERIRLVSARGAEPHEHRIYHEDNI